MSVSRLSQTSLQNAFQKFNNVWDGRSAAGSMDPIATYYCSATTTSISFSNIPQTYTHLQVRGFYRSAYATGGGYYISPLQSVSGGGGSFFSQSLYGLNGTYAFTTGGGANYTGASSVPNNNTANYFTVAVTDILDYTNTTKMKCLRTLNGWNSFGSGTVSLSSELKYSGSGYITQLDISDAGGGGWLAGTTFSLYGIK
jgi:hypothetical protein